jgi:hypothetical protein
VYADAVAVLQGCPERKGGHGRLAASAATAIAVACFGLAGPARADDKPDATVLETPGPAAPVPPRQAQIQYGVAFTVEDVAQAGPICNNASQPCILGSGGGIDARVGWRPSEKFYLGGAYEFSKQDPGKVYRLAILQQARLETRIYFPTGQSTEPFILLGAGLVSYGNEWSVATWGAGATFGVGLELELSGGSLLNFSIAYRPIFLRSFEDSIPAFHDAGLAHFITLEIALEAQDSL